MPSPLQPEPRPLPLSPYGARAEKIFDRLATNYERQFADKKEPQQEAVAQLLDELPSGARVLDVGCGTGRPTSAQLAAGGALVTGIDVSNVMLEQARRNVPGARFIRADALNSSCGHGEYDAVVSFFCLINLPAEEFTVALRNMREALVAGGRLLLAVPECLGGEQTVFMGTAYSPRPCSRQDLRDRATRAGLTVDEVYGCPDVNSAGEAAVSIFLKARRPQGF